MGSELIVWATRGGMQEIRTYSPDDEKEARGYAEALGRDGWTVRLARVVYTYEPDEGNN